MDTAIVIVQVLLGLFMFFAGLVRLVLPYTRITILQPWVKDFKPGIVRLISVVEICIGIAILLPLVMSSLTLLATLAAVGTALIIAGAMAVHLRREEYLHILGLAVWLGLALFFVYGGLLEVIV